MNPQEILTELARLGIRVWWNEAGGQERHSRTPKIRAPDSTPPELCEAIREHNDELLKIMDRRKGGVPGIYYRDPTANFSIVEPHRMWRTHRVLSTALLNYSYMHGVRGSMSPQSAVNHRCESQPKGLVARALRFVNMSPWGWVTQSTSYRAAAPSSCLFTQKPRRRCILGSPFPETCIDPPAMSEDHEHQGPKRQRQRITPQDIG